MNGNRITDLKGPTDASDAMTKRWVKGRFKEVQKHTVTLNFECVQDITRMERKYDTMIKGFEKKLEDKASKAECVNTNGGKIFTDIDMQKHHIKNPPLPKDEDDPVSKIAFTILENKFDSIRTIIQREHP